MAGPLLLYPSGGDDSRVLNDGWNLALSERLNIVLAQGEFRCEQPVVWDTQGQPDNIPSVSGAGFHGNGTVIRFRDDVPSPNLAFVNSRTKPDGSRHAMFGGAFARFRVEGSTRGHVLQLGNVDGSAGMNSYVLDYIGASNNRQGNGNYEDFDQSIGLAIHGAWNCDMRVFGNCTGSDQIQDGRVWGGTGIYLTHSNFSQLRGEAGGANAGVRIGKQVDNLTIGPAFDFEGSPKCLRYDDVDPGEIGFVTVLMCGFAPGQNDYTGRELCALDVERGASTALIRCGVSNGRVFKNDGRNTTIIGGLRHGTTILH